ncbi:type I-C CRISPR-associated protein Cas8c/Csd1 [Nocardia sp. NPDC056100]|uniref:type I-C CRISPR-associated protein Cas8c/Csd1 n=1 Tax=Nocardia sp. NPDC056100 TaxID=3345712 RepID=UPI0035D76E3F
MLIRQLAARHSDTETPRYYRTRTVRWAIHLDGDGKPQLIDRADADHKAGSSMATPYVGRTSGVAAMLLVDSMEYVLGISKSDTPKAQDDAGKRRDAFRELLIAWREATEDPIATVIAEFASAPASLELVEEAKVRGAIASELVCFVVGGEPVHMRPSAVDYWAQVARARKSSGTEGLCLSCGNVGTLLKTVPDMVKGNLIPVGVSTTGRPKPGRDAALVSVNTAAQGRAGKLQLVNTPLCEDCGSQAMATLNTMLADENHRRRSNDSVFVWWLREPAAFNPFILDAPHPTDVKALLAEVNRTRTEATAEDNEFYGLTLSANQSRVVVRDWIDVPLPHIKAHLAQWFTDHACTHTWADGVRHVELWRMAFASGRWDRRTEKYVPGSGIRGLERDLLRCALYGGAPPPTLIPQLLHRIRNDHQIDLARVAMLRFALARPPFKETTMPGLDDTATDPGYVWGRIFSVLEAIQRKAIPDINTTIQDKYFTLAMGQPAATMRMLRLNANKHLKKLTRNEVTRSAGYALDSRLMQLSSLVDDLPARLDNHGQIRFILGYDHQRAADISAARAAKAAKATTEAISETASVTA